MHSGFTQKNISILRGNQGFRRLRRLTPPVPSLHCNFNAL